MRTFIKISSLVFALLVTISLTIAAGTPEQEKAFTDKYKTAFEGKDTAALESLKPTKKLVIKIEKKDANGSSTSTTENLIAEKDGKFVIPVPGPCK